MVDLVEAHRRPSPALPEAPRVSARALERLIAALRMPQHDHERLAEVTRALLEGPVLDHASRRHLQLQRFHEQAARAMRQTDYYHNLFTRLGLDPATLRYEDIARLPTTPKEAVRKISDAIGQALKTPELHARIRSLEAEPLGNTPEEMREMIRISEAQWGPVVKAAKITVE